MSHSTTRAEITVPQLRSRLHAAIEAVPGRLLGTDTSGARLRYVSSAKGSGHFLADRAGSGASEGAFQFLGAKFSVSAPGKKALHCLPIREARLYSQNSRATPRLNVANSTQVRWSHRGRRGVGRLVNGHGRGICLEVPSAVGFPSRGARMAASIHFGADQVPGAARVLRRCSEPSGLKIGLEFQPEVAPHVLLDGLLTSHWPRLVRRASVPSWQVLQLLQRTGYLVLRPGIGVPPHWFTLDQPDISWDRVYVSRENELIGHVSLTRAYRHSWLAHQLVVDTKHPEAREAGQTIYMLGCFLPQLADPDEGILMAYFDRSKRWHARLFGEFVQWVGDEHDAVIADLERFEVNVEASTGARDSSCPPGFTIDRMRSIDEPVILDWVSRSLPALTQRALDLERGRLVQPHLHESFRDKKIRRSRDVLVLRREGRPVAAAMCERGTDVSIFGILDMAYFFTSEADLPMSVVRAFVDRIVDDYARAGVQHPLLVCPAGVLPREIHPGINWAETMGLMSFSPRGLRHYQNFLEFSHQWRQQRRRRSAA